MVAQKSLTDDIFSVPTFAETAASLEAALAKGKAPASKVASIKWLVDGMEVEKIQ